MERHYRTGSNGDGRSPVRWVGPLFMAIGALILLVGIYLVYDAVSFMQGAETAEGEVIRLEHETITDSDGYESTAYRPTFRFTDAGGAVHTGTSSVASSSYDFDIGERVEVFYDPTDPQDVRVRGLMSLFFLPVMITLMGAVFAGLGFAVHRLLGRG